MFRAALPMLLLLPSVAVAIGPAVFALESWPGEGVPVFTAVQDFTVPLYTDYSTSAAQAGVCAVRTCQIVNYTTSFVATVEGASISVPASQTLHAQSYGFTRFLLRAQYYEMGSAKRLELDKGDAVELLAHRACLLYTSPSPRD